MVYVSLRRLKLLGKIFVLMYGLIAYLVSLISICYAIGFIGNVLVPKSIDSGRHTDLLLSFFVDISLLTLFAIQHSVMARPRFKAAWTKIVPPNIERSTYVLLSGLLLCLLFWLWQPMPTEIWNVSDKVGRALMIGLFWLGWFIVLLSTFMISHLELFGLRQVLLNLQGKKCQESKFMIRGLYRVVRHPIMMGFIIAFWATPEMTLGHLLFAIVTTTYILIALQFEERDLIVLFGNAYKEYRKRVPLLFPWP